MYQPYPYQSECLRTLSALRDEGRNSALVVMASGLGKTVTVALDVKQWLEKNTGRVLFVCHQTDILYQAKATFEAVLGHGRTYGFFHGDAKDLHTVDCLFASFQTLERSYDMFDPKEFAYVVVDESHHAQAATYRPVVKYFRPQFLLGVTATPNRLDLRDIREIFGSEVFFLPLDEALAQGLVTPLDYRLLTDEIDLTQLLKDTPAARLSVKYLNRKIFVPKRDEEIARIIAQHASEFADPRIIIFCAGITACNHLTTFIPDSLTLHSEIQTKERSVRLELFRQGIVSTILTVDAFNEGVDIPQANVVVFLRSTESPTIFLQQLGRGLRRSEGKDKVIALDFVGNCERIKMVYDLWESVEEKLPKPPAAQSVRAVVSPMQLNIDHPGFKEKIVRVIELLARLQPKFISDVPELAKEYSAKNLLPPEKVLANTNARLWWKCSNSYSMKSEIRIAPGEGVVSSGVLTIECGHEWQTRGNHRAAGHGCPACAGRVPTDKTNLAATHPELAKEYSSKNTSPATKVRASSKKKYWWICANKHEWQARGDARVRGNGCPACAGQIASNTNNLAVLRPDLAKEYSAKNTLGASQVTASTSKKLWWQCSKCNYEWQAVGCSRVKGAGCPACIGRVVTVTNNLAITNPPLAAEYSSRNLKPANQVVEGTQERHWWQCKECSHEWQATGANRSQRRKRPSGCPVCAGRKPRDVSVG